MDHDNGEAVRRSNRRLHDSRCPALLLSSEVWVQIMFIGMSFCLPIAYWEQHRLKKKAKVPDPFEDPLLSLVRRLPLKDVCLTTHTMRKTMLLSTDDAVYIRVRGKTTRFEALQWIWLYSLESGFAHRQQMSPRLAPGAGGRSCCCASPQCSTWPRPCS